MSQNRSKKNDKRKKKKDAKGSKDNRRQHRLEKPIAKHPEILETVDTFFIHYRNDPKPDDFHDILTVIKEFNLLKIESQKLSIAALVASVYRQHLERQLEWRSDFAEEIQSSSWLFPAPDAIEGVAIRDYPHLQQCFLAWLVTGSEEYIQSLWDIACSYEDTLSEPARLLFQFYGEHHDDLADWVNARIAEKKESETPAEIAVRLKRETFSALLMKRNDAHRIIFIDYQVNDAEIVVLTADAGPLLNLDKTWDDVPVLVRMSTARERNIYRAWRDEMEEPV